MPNWKKIIVSGSDAALSSLIVTNEVTASPYTGSFSGSFSGDGSDITGLNPFPLTGSAAILGDMVIEPVGNNYVDNAYIDDYIEGGEGLNVNGNATIANTLTTEEIYIETRLVLTAVSQSLDFADDTAAAAGGVPKGGIYRNGNDIKIRIT